MLAAPVFAASTLLFLGTAASLPTTYFFAVAAGLAYGFISPAVSSLIADQVSNSKRPQAYGLLFWATNLGFSCAVLVGGAVATYSYVALFWIDSLGWLVFATIILFLLPSVASCILRTTDRGGYREVFSDGAMVVYLILVLLHATLQFQSGATLSLVMAGAGLSPRDYGLVSAVNGMLIIVIQIFILYYVIERNSSHVIAAGAFILETRFGIIGFVHSVEGYFITAIVWTLGEIVISAVVQSIVADLAPAHMRGRYLGVFGATYGLAGALAPLGGTLVLTYGGPTFLWTTCFLMGAIAAIGQIILARHIQDRRNRATITQSDVNS